MRTLHLKHLVPALAAACIALPAAAGVTVDFTKPDNYADVPFSFHEREDVFKELTRHFEKLGTKLGAGQDLKVEILDVDLAGRAEPNAALGRDLRILRGGADWPVISFKYAVTEGGKTVKSGEERLASMNYMRQFNHYSASEPLRYEKAMLDTWFKATFAAAQ